MRYIHDIDTVISQKFKTIKKKNKQNKKKKKTTTTKIKIFKYKSSPTRVYILQLIAGVCY
jgi:hypothetical protein